MEIKWLNDFLVLNDEGNFRVAAQLRNVSQPAFSRRIQALEAWVGAPLIDRSGQPAQLTEAGRLFLPVAKDIIDLATTGKQSIQTQLQADKERMRFAAVSSLAQIFIPGWLKSLQRLIEVNQFVVKTDFKSLEDYFAVLEEGNVDLFLCYESPVHRFKMNKSEFTSLKLGEETLVPVVSPNADGTPSVWLPDGPKKPIPCLHTLSARSPSPIRQHMKNKYSAYRFDSVYESSISSTLTAMAIEGFGLAWIPNAHIADDLAAGRLVRAADPVDDIQVDIRIYRCLKHSEPRVETFWKMLTQRELA